MAMPAQGEQDILFLTRLLALKRLIDDYFDGMCWLRGRQDTLGACKLHGCLESWYLVYGLSLDESQFN